MMTALVLGLGVRVFLESAELAKVVKQTQMRDTLVFLSPIASLAMIHYTLALKSFGLRSLQTEGLTYLAAVCGFLAITIPYYFGSPVSVSISECAWWKLWGCSTFEVRLNYWLLSIIVTIGAAALVRALKQEKIV